jgi:hypothetical protein
LLGEELKNCRLRDCQRRGKRKEEEEEEELASRGRDMNAALGSSVWPSSSSSFSSSPSLLLSCFCNCNGSLTTRHQASSSNNNDRSRFWKLSSSQSTSLLASRTRRHSHKKSFFSPYRQGLIQSCAGKTPPSPSPSPSPELAESEMSMTKERKQLGGGGLLEKKDDGAIVVERLFSNLNEATLEHEPGSLSSAVLLIAGTTVGAGILAIPSVTQESGFLASAVTCVTCWIYMVGTGLLVAEVNVNTMCELGSGGVSLVCFSDFLFLSFPNHDYGDFSIVIIITSDHVSSLTICVLCIVL